MSSLFPPIDRVTALSSRGPDGIFLKRPPVSRALSSHEGLSELASDLVRAKVPLSGGPSEGKIFFLFVFPFVLRP